MNNDMDKKLNTLYLENKKYANNEKFLFVIKEDNIEIMNRKNKDSFENNRNSLFSRKTDESEEYDNRFKKKINKELDSEISYYSLKDSKIKKTKYFNDIISSDDNILFISHKNLFNIFGNDFEINQYEKVVQHYFSIDLLEKWDSEVSFDLTKKRSAKPDFSITINKEMLLSIEVKVSESFESGLSSVTDNNLGKNLDIKNKHKNALLQFINVDGKKMFREHFLFNDLKNLITQCPEIIETSYTFLNKSREDCTDDLKKQKIRGLIDGVYVMNYSENKNPLNGKTISENAFIDPSGLSDLNRLSNPRIENKSYVKIIGRNILQNIIQECKDSKTYKELGYSTEGYTQQKQLGAMGEINILPFEDTGISFLYGPGLSLSNGQHSTVAYSLVKSALSIALLPYETDDKSLFTKCFEHYFYTFFIKYKEKNNEANGGTKKDINIERETKEYIEFLKLDYIVNEDYKRFVDFKHDFARFITPENKDENKNITTMIENDYIKKNLSQINYFLNDSVFSKEIKKYVKQIEEYIHNNNTNVAKLSHIIDSLYLNTKIVPTRNSDELFDKSFSNNLSKDVDLEYTTFLHFLSSLQSELYNDDIQIFMPTLETKETEIDYVGLEDLMKILDFHRREKFSTIFSSYRANIKYKSFREKYEQRKDVYQDIYSLNNDKDNCSYTITDDNNKSFGLDLNDGDYLVHKNKAYFSQSQLQYLFKKQGCSKIIEIKSNSGKTTRLNQKINITQASIKKLNNLLNVLDKNDNNEDMKGEMIQTIENLVDNVKKELENKEIEYRHLFVENEECKNLSKKWLPIFINYRNKYKEVKKENEDEKEKTNVSFNNILDYIENENVKLKGEELDIYNSIIENKDLANEDKVENLNTWKKEIFDNLKANDTIDFFATGIHVIFCHKEKGKSFFNKEDNLEKVIDYCFELSQILFSTLKKYNIYLQILTSDNDFRKFLDKEFEDISQSKDKEEAKDLFKNNLEEYFKNKKNNK